MGGQTRVSSEAWSGPLPGGDRPEAMSPRRDQGSLPILHFTRHPASAGVEPVAGLPFALQSPNASRSENNEYQLHTATLALAVTTVGHTILRPYGWLVCPCLSIWASPRRNRPTTSLQMKDVLAVRRLKPWRWQSLWSAATIGRCIWLLALSWQPPLDDRKAPNDGGPAFRWRPPTTAHLRKDGADYAVPIANL